MQGIFWMAYRMLTGNIKRALFPFLGVAGGITALIMALSLGAGGEKIISSNLMAIGNNRIMLGGDEMSRRDMKILENYPFVEYTLFPDARVIKNDNIFIGYPQRVLSILGMKNLSDREIVLDKNQFPDKKAGDKIDLYIDNSLYTFVIADMYEEKNPFELMRQGNRIILSQDYFEKLFGIYRFKQIVVSFEKNEDTEDILPIILKKFNDDRRGYNKIKLLETPEVYKRILKIQKMVKNTLGVLALISLSLGGFGIMNLVASGIRARSGHIGILRAMGMPKERVIKLFLTEGILVSAIGAVTGIMTGIMLSFIMGKLVSIRPEFNVLQIIISIIVSLVFGIAAGIHPAKKISGANIVEMLKES